jgi:hypothetical protein
MSNLPTFGGDAVIVLGGSFLPPHRGHTECLARTVQYIASAYAGVINVRVAMLVPSTQSWIRSKFGLWVTSTLCFFFFFFFFFFCVPFSSQQSAPPKQISQTISSNNKQTKKIFVQSCRCRASADGCGSDPGVCPGVFGIPRAERAPHALQLGGQRRSQGCAGAAEPLWRGHTHRY